MLEYVNLQIQEPVANVEAALHKAKRRIDELYALKRACNDNDPSAHRKLKIEQLYHLICALERKRTSFDV